MSDIRCTVSLKLVTDDPGTIDITYKFDFPDHLNWFAFTIIDGWNRIRTRGFEIDGRTCKWTGGGRSEQSIHIEYGVNDGPGTTGYVDTGEWAITKLPNLSWQLSYRSTGPVPEVIEGYRIPGEGIISSDGAVAYLGPHEEYVDTAPKTGEEFRLVVPHDAVLRDDPVDILSALMRASNSLDIGALNDSVVAIAAPTGGYSWPSKGRQRGDSGFWVRDDAVTDEINETWIHEYVHTRQLFNKTDESYWFREGTADYFASLAALDRGDINFDAFHGFLTRRGDSGAVLADPGTWSSNSTAYRQGRRTCAALDCKIRKMTDGESTLMNVVARLNEDGDADDTPDASNGAIREAVEVVTEADMSDWFNNYVHATRTPSVPRDEKMFALQVGSPVSELTLEIDTEPTPEPEPETEPTTEPELTPEPTPEPEPETTRRCPVCDTETTDRLCPTCGHKINEAPTGEPPESGSNQTCPICDTETTDPLCPTCGHELKQDPTGREPPRESPELSDEIVCPVCGTETIERLCPTCGHDLAPRCPVCDSVGTSHDEYCAICGRELRG